MKLQVGWKVVEQERGNSVEIVWEIRQTLNGQERKKSRPLRHCKNDFTTYCKLTRAVFVLCFNVKDSCYFIFKNH